MDISNGFWLMPSKGRATTNLPRFFAGAKKTGMTTPGYVVVNAAEYEAQKEFYDAVELPPNWRILKVSGETAADKTREAMSLVGGAGSSPEWVGWLGDDLVPETSGWDVEVVKSLNGWNVVSTNDGVDAPNRMNGATAWSADLVRAVGYLFPPGIDHFFFDDAWEQIGKVTQCWQVRMDIMVRHRHGGLSGDATTVGNNKHWANDERAYTEWRKHEMMPAVERVLKLMESAGIPMGRPDVAGLRVMIATPTGSGRLENLYEDSLINTIMALKQFGAEVQVMKLPYVSDVALARNQLFGRFLRSDSTHLFFIDDDMAWRFEDVIRLLMAKVPFAAAAGPRKVFPPSFAVNVSDDQGRPVPLRVDDKTGMFDVTGVGMAFCCLTHDCAERMASEYRDLAFAGADGREDFGVFNPIIFNHRYLAEDYAFCHRWRQIGGKILVAPDIELGHVGTYVWRGSWIAQLEDKMRQERSAA